MPAEARRADAVPGGHGPEVAAALTAGANEMPAPFNESGVRHADSDAARICPTVLAAMPLAVAIAAGAMPIRATLGRTGLRAPARGPMMLAFPL